MTKPASRREPDHHGHVKWFCRRRGYGFVFDECTKRDIFVHAEGLTGPLRKHPPGDGDAVTFTVLHRDSKRDEAIDVARIAGPGAESDYPFRPPRRTRSQPMTKEGTLQAKIVACIHTAKAIAGEDLHRLRGLIPLLLHHNGLPPIYVPVRALTITGRPLSQRKRTPAATAAAEGDAAEDARHNSLPAADESEAATTTDSEDEAEDEDEPPPPRRLPSTPVSRPLARKEHAALSSSTRKSDVALTDDAGTDSEEEERPGAHEPTTAAAQNLTTRSSRSQTIAAKVKDGQHNTRQQTKPEDDEEGWTTKVGRTRKQKTSPTFTPQPSQSSAKTTKTTNKKASKPSDEQEDKVYKLYRTPYGTCKLPTIPGMKYSVASLFPGVEEISM